MFLLKEEKQILLTMKEDFPCGLPLKSSLVLRWLCQSTSVLPGNGIVTQGWHWTRSQYHDVSVCWSPQKTRLQLPDVAAVAHLPLGKDCCQAITLLCPGSINCSKKGQGLCGNTYWCCWLKHLQLQAGSTSAVKVLLLHQHRPSWVPEPLGKFYWCSFQE